MLGLTDGGSDYRSTIMRYGRRWESIRRVCRHAFASPYRGFGHLAPGRGHPRLSGRDPGQWRVTRSGTEGGLYGGPDGLSDHPGQGWRRLLPGQAYRARCSFASRSHVESSSVLLPRQERVTLPSLDVRTGHPSGYRRGAKEAPPDSL